MPKLLDANFHKFRQVRGLEKVTVRQKFGNHTITTLDYQITNHRNYLLPPEETPVSVRFGRTPIGIATQYGYVNHFETGANDRDSALVQLFIVGTSKPMNAVNPSSWEGHTRSAIVRKIAARHKLRSVVHTHPAVVEHWSSGTRSDLACLRALASETGYHLWVDGSTVRFLDPERVVRGASSMTTPLIRNTTVHSVEVLGGSNIPGEMEASTRLVQHGLDYRTNEFFTATSGDPSRPAAVSTRPVSTFAEAQYEADAGGRKERDYYILKATFKGNAKIQPGSTVQFESGRVNRDQKGLWLVSEATHEITRDKFTTRIVASRGANPRELARVASTTRNEGYGELAVIRNNRVWEAALQEHVRA